MKKFALSITFGLLLLAVGGYLVYIFFFNRSKVEPWDVVPAETVLVYESSACSECLKQLERSPVAKLIKATTFSNSTDSTDFFSELISSAQPGTLISLHITKRDDFGFVFYIPLNQPDRQALEAKLTKLRSASSPKVLFSEREYNGIKIQEMTKEKELFSWIFIENVWVASFTSILIEDVIRTYRSDENFKTRLGGVYQLTKMKNDGGNVYVNLNGFAQLISLFTIDQPAAVLQNFGQSALLDVKQEEHGNFILNGFTQDSVLHSNYLLSAFKNQKPIPFSMKEFVSNRTIMFTSYGISDGKKFFTDLRSVNQARHTTNDSLALLAKAWHLDLTKPFNNLSGEVSVSFVESKKQATSTILLIHNTNGADEWWTALNAISQKLSIDTIFYEPYADYEIRELPLYHFPEKIFAPLVSGFDNTYYTRVGNVILLAEDLEELKLYLDDIDREETWGKSVAQNKFLESTLLESNISAYINSGLAFTMLSRSLQPRWKEFIQENQPLLNDLGMLSIQFSHLNDSYYTNISWSANALINTNRNRKSATPSKVVTNFNQPITSFFAVKNHQTKSTEVLAQDAIQTLRLVSDDGAVLWSLSLDNSIQGDVQQVDYFNNGKLQYLFATAGQLHLVDRLGKYVAPFPIKISERNVEYLSVIDYDHSKKYRFLITGKNGKLWMYDKEGKNLEGWNPNANKAELVTAPQHHRIRGKDYIVMVQRDGKVLLVNRRGETLKNFPLDLNARPSGEYFLEQGKGVENTYFVVVSREGFRIKFTLDGKIHSRETLVKNSADARFSLVAERDSKAYLILRQEATQLTLFNEELKEILINTSVGNNAVTITYADFGGGRAYITVTDASQDLSFIYNQQGKLLTDVPLESHAIFVRPVERGSLKVFTFIDGTITIQPL